MKVWFTRGLSNTAEAIALIRSDPAAPALSLMASHVDPDNALRLACPDFHVEPRKIGRADYADWLIETATRAGVTLIVVQRRAADLWRDRDRFAAQGIRLLIPAAPETLDLLDDKAAFQADLADPDLAAAGVHGHAALEFSDVAGFDAARETLMAAGEAPHGICVKPVTSIFGAGFRRIEDGGDDFAWLLSQDPSDQYRISLRAFREAMQTSRKQRRMILMPYLPGAERSVDFVSDNGRLVAAVARIKTGRHQRLETRGPAIETARALARRYGLNGQCNLQTREMDGRQVVLEINARMSGGMAMACLAGVNLPLLAVLGGLGLPLPPLAPPRDGLVVGMFEEARIVSDPRAN